MDKEILMDEFEEKTAVEIWESLYNKELNCKKNILEYIDITRLLKKANLDEDKLAETYNYIYDHIEGLKDSIKPNTMMYLKNTLKAQLGKYVVEKDPKPENNFIKFFKAAYPVNARRKDFTWVMMDINNISEEQIWTTLTYINRRCLSNNLRLTSEEKKDITEVIEKSLSKNNIKYINNLKALKQLMYILHISIIREGDSFKLKKN
jgi:hypothetical protein